MKTRVIAAFALLPLLLVVVLACPKLITMILLGAMAAVASWELLAGTGIVKMPRLCLYTALMAFWSVLWSALQINAGWLALGVMVFWCLLFMEVALPGNRGLLCRRSCCALLAGLHRQDLHDGKR